LQSKYLIDGDLENDYCLLAMDVTPQAETQVSAPTQPNRVSSEALLGQKKELVILHNGREYRLRLTQNGKLILTA
jgi:hemin uptake protein HemP